MVFTPIHSQGKHAHTKTSQLTYQGGNVEVTPSVYLDFWGSWWNTSTITGTDSGISFTNADAMTYINEFFGGVGGSSWANVTSQYCQGVATGTIDCGSGGTHITNPSGQVAGVMVDTSNTVPNRITQGAIANEAASAAASFTGNGSLPQGATVIVFTPSGQSMRGFGTQWCAWHSTTSYDSTNMAYAYMPYQPDAGAACGENFVYANATSFGNGYFDGFSVVGGHEYAEAQTDPIPANGTYGWLDTSGSEIGDKCAWASNSGPISLSSGSFAVQPLWSNADSGCVLSY